MTESPVPPLPAASLTPFFEPACVAVVGASRERNKIGSEVLHNLVATGFTGAVVPIHPSAESIQGLKAYPLLVHVPFAVDLAIIDRRRVAGGDAVPRSPRGGRAAQQSDHRRGSPRGHLPDRVHHIWLPGCVT